MSYVHVPLQNNLVHILKRFPKLQQAPPTLSIYLPALSLFFPLAMCLCLRIQNKVCRHQMKYIGILWFRLGSHKWCFSQQVKTSYILSYSMSKFLHVIVRAGARWHLKVQTCIKLLRLHNYWHYPCSGVHILCNQYYGCRWVVTAGCFRTLLAKSADILHLSRGSSWEDSSFPFPNGNYYYTARRNAVRFDKTKTITTTKNQQINIFFLMQKKTMLPVKCILCQILLTLESLQKASKAGKQGWIRGESQM